MGVTKRGPLRAMPSAYRVATVASTSARSIAAPSLYNAMYGAITKEAIAEAMELANEALMSHAGSLADGPARYN